MIKACSNCKLEFEIDQQDQDFYSKIDVPHPTYCPFCRQNRRLAMRNARTLYNRKCDLCAKNIIAIYPANSEYTVYCNDCWHGDKCQPLDAGIDYDPERNFFEQINELQNRTPLFALHQDKNSVNCKYVNFGISNKNCYLAFCAYCEDVYYSDGTIQCKSCMDCTKCVGAELCYECVDCNHSYNLLFSQDCDNCSDSYFLKECVSCSECFCCIGLRNKKYCFMNEELTEEEYKKRLQEIELTNSSIKEWKEKLEQASLKVPKKYMMSINAENSTGDYLHNCKNLKHCFDCLDEAERIAYGKLCGKKCFDSYDISNAGLGTELCYEAHGIIANNNCKFNYYCDVMQDSEYSQYCFSSKNLFGCIGLKHKEYCILNKQYSKEEYEKLKTKIIKKMREDKEYGEFFPEKYSRFGYNETVAQECAPLSKEEALAKGFKWREIKKEKKPATFAVPNSFHEIPKNIVDEILECQECKDNYKVIEQEYQFYKKFQLPVPKSCHSCRHKKRFAQRRKPHLYKRSCDKCQIQLTSTFPADAAEKVYCQQCYLEEMF